MFEQTETPRKAGNMAIVSRCMVRGYKLACNCINVFEYVPGESNSISVNGAPKALCPKCNCIWNESLEFVGRPDPYYYIFYIITPEGEEKKLMLGRAATKTDATIQCLQTPVLKLMEWKGFRIDFIDRDEYEAHNKEINELNAGATKEFFEKAFGSVMANLMGDLLGG